MQLLNALVLATASTVSAAAIETRATGVTLYKDIFYRGISYEVPSLGRCWAVPQTLDRQVSSIRVATSGTSCAIFRNRFCLPPSLYAGIRSSIPNLHNIGIGDEIGSIFCSSFSDADD
ncbi:hypothetical protein NLG97_g9970 [Lecanicillium saksenae]|uniref:Uncharacterized protein n=1 Tax=Lecanicillium saksenae TaxID=468837 RepID=A0ACC1QIG6_9HYPO|nr:hypothetical protein NLG97_g9970 [Lecanicillium saksenae]